MWKFCGSRRSVGLSVRQNPPASFASTKSNFPKKLKFQIVPVSFEKKKYNFSITPNIEHFSKKKLCTRYDFKFFDVAENFENRKIRRFEKSCQFLWAFPSWVPLMNRSNFILVKSVFQWLFTFLYIFSENYRNFEKKILTVATPWTCAVVPSGKVMIGLLGSTWIMETVPSAFVIVCKTAVGYWAIWIQERYQVKILFRVTAKKQAICGDETLKKWYARLRFVRNSIKGNQTPEISTKITLSWQGEYNINNSLCFFYQILLFNYVSWNIETLLNGYAEIEIDTWVAKKSTITIFSPFAIKISSKRFFNWKLSRKVRKNFSCSN